MYSLSVVTTYAPLLTHVPMSTVEYCHLHLAHIKTDHQPIQCDHSEWKNVPLVLLQVHETYWRTKWNQMCVVC